MRRPPVVPRTRARRAVGAVGAGAFALVLVLAACNDKPTDADTEKPSVRTTAELIPFDSSASESEPEPEETEPEETEPDDTEPEETEPEDTEPEIEEIDPMPGDTATFDTRPSDDALCEAAQAILDADDAYQDVIAEVLKASGDESDAFVRALQNLPLDDIRIAYDDLENEVPQNLRGRVALIRDFTLEHGQALSDVEDLEQLSELIAEIEDDPDAARVTRALTAVSAYTDDECGIAISQGG